MENADKKSRSFRLLLVDPKTYESLWSLRFTKISFVITVVSAFVIVVVGVCCLAYIPIRAFVPAYPDAYSRRQAVQNLLRIDSLETRILQWELYSENLRRVVEGNEPIRMDSLILGMNIATSREEADAEYLALRDSLLRADVLVEEQFEVGHSSRRNLPIEALSFYPPVKGVISKGFDRTFHSWVDVTTPAGTMIMSVLDGTVLYTCWEEGSGYTLVVQHDGDIVSVYKNSQSLLRKRGDWVKAGTPVGVVASSPSLTKGDHLHFELWYNGEAVDPMKYIKF